MKKQGLNTVEIEHLAHLARLEITPAEKKKYAEQLSAVLEYVSQLGEVSGDITESKPELTNVWREDEVKPCGISRDQLLANTPETEDGFIKVPRILE